MSGISTLPSARPPSRIAIGALRVGCEASFTLSVVLLVASVMSGAFAPAESARALRTGMISFGVPLLAVAMAIAAFASHRIAHATAAREVHRVRERLYFVAALVLTVLVPSALLGARAVLMPRPGGAMAVYVVEAGAWLLAAWLQWGNVGDAHRLVAEGEVDQLDAAPRAPERSMSSIR